MRIAVLFVSFLWVGCAGASASSGGAEGASTTGASQSEDGQVDLAEFYNGCMSACDAGEQCEGYCSCSRDKLAADPTLGGVVTSDDPEEALNQMMSVLLPACGEGVLASSFVGSCASGCTEEGASAELCSSVCSCAYQKVRAAHPGEKGMVEIVAMLEREDLDEFTSAVEACVK